MKDEYIGRNALLSIITTKFNEHYGNACYQFIHDFYRFVIRKICAAPAADVVEVRHGRWEWNENAMDWGLGGWVCSECRAKNDNIPAKPDTNPTAWNGSHYCPNCGAKMDKEE